MAVVRRNILLRGIRGGRASGRIGIQYRGKEAAVSAQIRGILAGELLLLENGHFFHVPLEPAAGGLSADTGITGLDQGRILAAVVDQEGCVLLAGESGGRPEDWTSLEYRIMGYIAKRNRERKEADAIPEDMLAAEKGDMEPKASLGAFGQGEEAEPEEAEEAVVAEEAAAESGQVVDWQLPEPNDGPTEPAVSTVAEAVSEELEFHPDHKAVLTAPEPEEATADAAGQETQSEQETASALFEEEKPGEETSWEADGFMEEAMAQAAQTEEEDMTIFVIGTDGRDQEIRVSKSAMAEELRNLEESYLEEEVLGEPQPEYQEDRALEEKIGAPQGESPLFGEPDTGWESIAEETVSVPKERPWRYAPTPVREAHVAPPELSGMEDWDWDRVNYDESGGFYYYLGTFREADGRVTGRAVAVPSFGNPAAPPHLKGFTRKGQCWVLAQDNDTGRPLRI